LKVLVWPRSATSVHEPPAMAFTIAFGTPCCRARSRKLCRIPCTITGYSIPATMSPQAWSGRCPGPQPDAPPRASPAVRHHGPAGRELRERRLEVASEALRALGLATRRLAPGDVGLVLGSAATWLPRAPSIRRTRQSGSVSVCAAPRIDGGISRRWFFAMSPSDLGRPRDRGTDREHPAYRRPQPLAVGGLDGGPEEPATRSGIASYRHPA